MATFEAQVESLTGIAIDGSSSPTQTELSQFLNDGVLDVTNRCLAIKPEDRKDFMTVSSLQVAQGLALTGADVISVLRADGVTAGNFRPCRQISQDKEYLVTKPSSLEYASKFNPAYMMTDSGKISVFPAPSDNSGKDSYKAYYVNKDPVNGSGSALVYSHDDILHFPRNKVYLVVMYASIKSLENAIRALTVTEYSATATAPEPPSAPNITSPGVTSTTVGNLGTAPSYTKPTITDAQIGSTGLQTFAAFSDSTLLAGDLDVNATSPTNPETPNFSYDDTDFSQPQKWFDAWSDMIEDQGDLEKAQVQGQKVSTYLQAWQNAITQQQQEFNSNTTAYNSEVQKKIQNAQLEQQRITTRFQGQLSINQQNALQNLQSEIQLYTAKLQRYQNEVTDYQNEVNEQVQEYTLTLQREMQAWQSHQANVFQHWGVLIQNELNEYNKELAIYQTTVQKAIQDAQMEAQEKQKEGDLTLQASIQDYTLELQNYQAQLQQYANEIQEDVQETTLKIQRDAELYKRYDNDHKKLQQQYDAAFVIMGGGQQQQGG